MAQSKTEIIIPPYKLTVAAEAFADIDDTNNDSGKNRFVCVIDRERERERARMKQMALSSRTVSMTSTAAVDMAVRISVYTCVVSRTTHTFILYCKMELLLL